MTTSFDAIENAETIIFSSSLITLAATACDTLEYAGIPAALCRDEGRYAVIIPDFYAVDASLLLNANCYSGEAR